MESKSELIVECSLDTLSNEICNKICTVKYTLPLIGCVVVEIEKSNIDKLKEIASIKAVHKVPHITAQMNKARSVINAEELEYTGEGVTIAFLDTGISPVRDFDGRIVAFRDFTTDKQTPYDDNGHGTHVAGIACGSGALSNGKYRGIATKANIASIKTLDLDGKGSASDILAGMQWICDNRDKYNIRIVNLSIGAASTTEDDPLVRASEALWDMGITVITAAGNNGPAPCTISSPGISKKIITVGSSDDSSEVNIWGMALKNFSGRGPTAECIVKPDVLAPGSSIVSCLANDIKSTKGENYRLLSGTSMSTPMVSGAVACLLQKQPDLSPDDVKYMLKLSCTALGYPRNQEGWGLLNVKELLSREVFYVRTQ